MTDLDQLDQEHLAALAAAVIARLDDKALARAGGAWWLRLDALAKRDPFVAGELARAMYAMVAAYRPESPAPLDAGFVPTEPIVGGTRS